MFRSGSVALAALLIVCSVAAVLAAAAAVDSTTDEGLQTVQVPVGEELSTFGSSPIVSVTGGRVQGYVSSGVAVYRGIPFAGSPTGNNRLRPPPPVTPWSGVKQTILQAQICPQFRITDWLFLGGEDCLFMNVYTPQTVARKENEPLKPVLLWIFGGGWVLGDGWEFGWYDGSDLVRAKDYVVVTFNYRLGPLGFMALDGLANEAADGSVGNYGLLDQRAAMEWVQKNIASFGGDPNKVTIAGESAGAFSVCWHLASPGSRGLFSAAILESGTCDSPQFFVPREKMYQWSTTYAAMVGCDGSGAQLVDCLRKVPTGKIMGSYSNPPPQVNEFLKNWNSNSSNINVESSGSRPFIVVNGQKQLHPGAEAYYNVMIDRLNQVRAKQSNAGYIPALYPFMPWSATIDGTYNGMPDVPLNMIASGNFSQVPIIMGSNKDEGTIFVPVMPLILAGRVHFPLTQSDLTTVFLHFFNNNQTIVDQVLQNYPLYSYSDPDSLAAAVLRDYFFVCAARKTLQIVSAQNITSWLYHFTFKGDFIETPILGDYHTAELQFVFNHPWPPLVHIFSAADKEMARIFTTYYANFVYTGSPNSARGDVTYWPPYSADNRQNIVLEVPEHVQQDLYEGQCQFWDSVSEQLAQQQ